MEKGAVGDGVFTVLNKDSISFEHPNYSLKCFGDYRTLSWKFKEGSKRQELGLVVACPIIWLLKTLCIVRTLFHPLPSLSS